MTTKQMMERISHKGCQKGEIQDYRIDQAEKNINAIGIKIDETMKATDNKITKIHDRIDNMKTMAMIQLISVIFMLIGIVVNLLKAWRPGP